MKIVRAEEAVARIKDGDTITTGGGVGIGFPELVIRTLGASNKKNLTLFHAAGQGDGKDRGLNHLATPGLLKRVIGGHWGLSPKLQALARANKIEAYCIPQGVASQLFRDIAAKRPGHLTEVGLSTFVDPRHGGGRLNKISTSLVVEYSHEFGCLFYPAFPIHVAIIRATASDNDGNLSMEREALTMDSLAQAMAARNSGGIVIAQVRKVTHFNLAKTAKIPAHLVDYVVLAEYEADHPYTFAYGTAEPPLLSTAEQTIIERALKELKPGDVVNVGIGLAGEVAKRAFIRNMIPGVTFTTESGSIGGVPLTGLNFGAAAFDHSVIDQSYQFDFYDGGGLDVAFLGFAEIDRTGCVNVSKFGDRIAGAGGFINITRAAKKLVFVGTEQSSGGQNKFVDQVEQVTFRADNKREILCITDRHVYRLTDGAVTVIEDLP